MALTIDRHQLEISNRGNAGHIKCTTGARKNRVGSTSTDIPNPVGAHNQ
jgi:hypothetical protein